MMQKLKKYGKKQSIRHSFIMKAFMNLQNMYTYINSVHWWYAYTK